MKQSVKSPNSQLSLPLLSATTTVIPDHQQDLTRALVELLMSAADEGIESQEKGGGDESEAHR
jgi:hypothetical protein